MNGEKKQIEYKDFDISFCVNDNGNHSIYSQLLCILLRFHRSIGVNENGKNRQMMKEKNARRQSGVATRNHY